MTATAGMIFRFRRMIAESDDTNGYVDLVLREIVERYPLLDSEGLDSTDDDWTATYDLNAAASEVWTEKAAALAASSFDFTSDGASFSLSQKLANAAKMQRYYSARRAIGSIQMVRVTNDDDDLETV